MEKKRRNAMIGLALVILLTASGAVVVGSFLPMIGNHNTPANAYVSNYYILNTETETGASSIVTAVLGDYRSFATLFEICALFISGIVTYFILSSKTVVQPSSIEKKISEMHFGGMILTSSFRMIVPVIFIYGIYVLFHGEVSLGGGFQAGALLACAYLLDRIIPSTQNQLGRIKEETALKIAAFGILIYLITGIAPMLNGGRFLEYGKLPIKTAYLADLHAIGIFLTEVGVTVCVMAVLINNLEAVLERTEFDD